MNGELSHIHVFETVNIKLSVEDRIMAPKDAHTLVPSTCQYVFDEAKELCSCD